MDNDIDRVIRRLMKSKTSNKNPVSDENVDEQNKYEKLIIKAIAEECRHDTSVAYESKFPWDYLKEKARLTMFDKQEELIFYPELYGICPKNYHAGCLHLYNKEASKIKEHVQAFVKRTSLKNFRYPMMRYVEAYNFVEMHLNFLNLNDSNFPPQVFLCRNLRVLNIADNSIVTLPVEIGRLKKLETLVVSNNEIKRFPKTLKFCRNLREIYMEGNTESFAFGFILGMKSVRYIRTHPGKYREFFANEKLEGDSNFVKILSCCKTVNEFEKYVERASEKEEPWTKDVGGNRNFAENETRAFLDESLFSISVKKVVENGFDFFLDGIPVHVQRKVCAVYWNYRLCDFCGEIYTNLGTRIPTTRFQSYGYPFVDFIFTVCKKPECAKGIIERHFPLELKSKQALVYRYSNKALESGREKKKPKKNSCCNVN